MKLPGRRNHRRGTLLDQVVSPDLVSSRTERIPVSYELRFTLIVNLLGSRDPNQLSCFGDYSNLIIVALGPLRERIEPATELHYGTQNQPLQIELWSFLKVAITAPPEEWLHFLRKAKSCMDEADQWAWLMLLKVGFR
jgi:hypothetical protein